MKLKVTQNGGVCWVVEDDYGKYFGLGMAMGKRGAEEMLNAMQFAFAEGQRAKALEIKRALDV